MRNLKDNVYGSLAVALVGVLIFGGVLYGVDRILVSADKDIDNVPEGFIYVEPDEFKYDPDHGGTYIEQLVEHKENNPNYWDQLWEYEKKYRKENTDSGILGFFTLDLNMFKGLDVFGDIIRSVYSGLLAILSILVVAEILPFCVFSKKYKP